MQIPDVLSERSKAMGSILPKNRHTASPSCFSAPTKGSGRLATKFSKKIVKEEAIYLACARFDRQTLLMAKRQKRACPYIRVSRSSGKALAGIISRLKESSIL
jgi:hypothetical protein